MDLGQPTNHFRPLSIDVYRSYIAPPNVIQYEIKCILVSVSLDLAKYDSSAGRLCVAAIVNATNGKIHSKRIVIFDVLA